MANVIHRTTLQFLASVNTPDYPEPTWQHNPDMSATLGAGVPFRYWKPPVSWTPGAGPVEMTAGEKTTKDATLLAAERDAAMVRLAQFEDVMRNVLVVILNRTNLMSARINSLKSAIDNGATLAAVKTAVALIPVLTIPNETDFRTAVRNQMGNA